MNLKDFIVDVRQQAIFGNVSYLQSGFKSLASSIGLSTTALGGFLAVAAGITAAVVLFDTLNVSADEARDALTEMQSNYDETTAEVETLNSELETTKDRIDELNAKENLTLVEQEELATLQKTNSELERKLALKEAEQRIDARKAAEQAEETYKEWTTDDIFGFVTGTNEYDTSKIKDIKDYTLKTGTYSMGGMDFEGVKDNINELIGRYEAIQEEMESVASKRDELLKSDDKQDLLQAETLADYYNTLEEKSLEGQNYIDAYALTMEDICTAYENAVSSGTKLSEIQKEQWAQAKSFLTEYMKMYTGASEVEGGINTLLSKSAFIGVKDELVKAGETSRSVLDGVIAKTPGLTEALDEAGISAQQLGDYIMAIADPDALRIDEIKQELKDAFETDDYEISFHAGESADAVWNEFISDKSDEEIEIFYKYVNNNDIDISKHSGEDLEATFTVAVKGQENLQDVEDTFSSILSSEDITKQVDDFQSNISTIQDVLDKLKAGEFTDSDITDLKQQFPSLVTETENLESALNNLAVDNFISTMSSIQTAMEDVTDPTQLAVMKSFGEDLKKQLISALDMSDVTADDLLNNFKEVTSLDNWNPTAFQNSFGKLVSEFGGSEAGRAGLITLAAAIELDPSLAYADYETLKAYVEDNKFIADIEFSQNRIEELQSQMTALQDEATKVQDSLSLKEAKGIKPLVSDYTKLVNNSEQQVWNLKKQNAELQKQLVELDVNGSKYQEIQSQINANVSAIDQAKIAQIEWNEQASRLRYEPNEGLTAYNKAKSTRNAGDNYLDMMSGLKEAKEAYDAGLIGTDDFKEYARMISPSGATDPANFLENYGKVSEWFTEGADGVKTFLNELDSKGLAEFNEETQQWTYSIEDMAKAANQMGVSEEVMLAMFGRLEDYGFRNNYVSSVEDGVQRLSNLYSDLAKEEALLKEMESKPSEYTDEQVQSKKDLIESIKQNIDETGQSMDYVVANAGETYNTQIESAKSAIESLAEQRKNILDNNLYGENSEAVANQLEKQILGLAEENGLQLNLEYNVVGQEDVTNATNALRTLQENGKISIDLDFNKSDMSADELQQKIDELNETKATINVDDEGGQEALDEINAIINACETEKQLKLALDKGSTVNDLLQLTDEELINTLQIDTSQVDVAKQRLQEIAEGEEIPITVKIDESQFNQLLETEKSITVDSSSIDEAQEKANTLNETSIEDKAVNVNSSSINEAQKKLDKINATNLENKTFSVTSNASTTLSTLSTLDSYLSRIDGRVVSYTVNKTVTESSGSFASGTLTPARANGTAYNVLNMKPAYANGRKVALEHDETALVNELGMKNADIKSI